MWSVFFQDPLKEGFDQDRHGEGDWVHLFLRTCKKTRWDSGPLHGSYNKIVVDFALYAWACHRGEIDPSMVSVQNFIECPQQLPYPYRSTNFSRHLLPAWMPAQAPQNTIGSPLGPREKPMSEPKRGGSMKGHGGRKPVLPPIGGVEDPDSLYQHMQRYLLSLVVRGQSQHTAASSKAALTRFIRWSEKRSLSRPSEIDRPLVELFQQSLFFHRKRNGEPLTARSMQFLLIPLRQWFSWMVKQGHLPFSPASELELPRVPRRLPTAILSAQEAETVLAVPDVSTAVGLRDRAILETLYSTGVRRTELTRLTIQDIDRDRGTLMVREGKGRKDRMIPIGDRALAWIATYRDRARPELMLHRSPKPSQFCSPEVGHT